MRTLASVYDVEARLGRRILDPETARVVSLLEDASDLVRLEAGTDWVDEDGADLPVPGAIRLVTCRMVDRAIRNPDGYSAESDGDYSYQRIRVESGGVYMTDADRTIIRRSMGRKGIWTAPVTRGEEYTTTVWYEDQFGCELFPLDVYRVNP